MRTNHEEEKPQSQFLEALMSDEKYCAFSKPVDIEHFPVIHDAEFFILKNGLVVNAEGWYHPDDKFIGEVLYAPDAQGNKNVFGQRYRKVTLFPETFIPVPYAERG